MHTPVLRILAGVLLLLYCLCAIWYLLERGDDYQWDFKVYYYCARAHRAGLNPYEMAVGSTVGYSSSVPGLIFPYHPAFLTMLSPLAGLRYTTACHFFFGLKCVLIVGLLTLWMRGFLERGPDLLFCLFCLVAFDSPFYIALQSGNVAVIEQCALWLAFYFFLRRRLGLFCGILLLSASIKVAPLLFLLLLLCVEDRRRYLYLFCSLAAFGAMTLLCSLSHPGYFSGFMHNAGQLVNETKYMTVVMQHLSPYAFIGDLLALLEGAGITVPYGTQTLIFRAFAAAVLYVTWRAWCAIRSRQLPGGRRDLVYLACAAYVLVLPYVEDYSYIILLLPAYVIMRRACTPQACMFLFILLSSLRTTLPVFHPVMGIALRYYPLILGFLVWVLYVREAAGAFRGGGKNAIASV